MKATECGTKLQRNMSQSPFNDKILISKAVNGDRDAREQLALACIPRARNLVFMSYGPHDDADDVIQIALALAFRELSQLKDVHRFSAWFASVVLNTVRSHGRRKTRFFSIFSKENSECHSITETTPEYEMQQRQLFAQLHAQLTRISLKKRTAATMSLLGYVDSEIADFMSCNVETAKKRVQHGRRELFTLLQKNPEYRQILEEVLS